MYNPKEELKQTDDRSNIEWEIPSPAIEFLLRPKAILFDVQDIEPQYFVSVALYDIDTKSKITETVYFDISSKNLLVSYIIVNLLPLLITSFSNLSLRDSRCHTLVLQSTVLFVWRKSCREILKPYWKIIHSMYALFDDKSFTS